MTNSSSFITFDQISFFPISKKKALDTKKNHNSLQTSLACNVIVLAIEISTVFQLVHLLTICVLE